MEPDGRPLELRNFSRRVNWVVVLVCSVLFVGGIQLSGINLDKMDPSSRTFTPEDKVCIRSESLAVSKESRDSFDVCVEWIDLKDTSGSIHHLDPRDLDIAVGPEGEVRVRRKSRINFHLVGLIAYLFLLIFVGNAVQTRIIGLRRKKIEGRDGHRHSGLSI